MGAFASASACTAVVVEAKLQSVHKSSAGVGAARGFCEWEWEWECVCICEWECSDGSQH